MITVINRILCMVLIMTVMGCAACNRTTRAPQIPVDPYESLTADSIAKECPVPVEHHYVPGILVIDTPLQVVRFKYCLGHPDLLVMNFLGQNNETVKTYIHLMMLLYVESVKETTGALVEPELVKESRLTVINGVTLPENEEVWFIIYKLTPKVLESPEPAEDSAP